MHQLATLPDQPLVVSTASVNNATKLLRAFSQQLEALNRYRGKGQQKVTVEHVHVHSDVLATRHRPPITAGEEAPTARLSTPQLKGLCPARGPQSRSKCGYIKCLPGRIECDHVE
jgi:hypothetical protein